MQCGDPAFFDQRCRRVSIMTAGPAMRASGARLSRDRMASGGAHHRGRAARSVLVRARPPAAGIAGCGGAPASMTISEAMASTMTALSAAKAKRLRYAALKSRATTSSGPNTMGTVVSVPAYLRSRRLAHVIDAPAVSRTSESISRSNTSKASANAGRSTAESSCSTDLCRSSRRSARPIP